jgi:curved DNA-binding protein CbpA
MNMNDPYAVLGVSRSASDAEVTAAYRKMAKKYHPDLNPGDKTAAAKMSEVNAAYDMIKSGNSSYMHQGNTYRPSSYSSSYDPSFDERWTKAYRQWESEQRRRAAEYARREQRYNEDRERHPEPRRGLSLAGIIFSLIGIKIVIDIFSALLSGLTAGPGGMM